MTVCIEDLICCSSKYGSAYQSPDLVRRLHPRVALISVGADNDYGHPARAGAVAAAG